VALVNVAAREIHCKIIYYGPGFGGKTTNVVKIHEEVPGEAKGELLSIATETERTLFFDFLPLDLGSVEGYKVRFQVYTVPGQPMYERTRVAVLTGVDGVVFVADSGRERFRENLQSMEEMRRILEALGRPLDQMPLVIQYNKRDLPDAVPIPVLEARLNKWGAPHVEATASTGTGVLPTLREISKLVVARL
jgi:signal recognition particle receptor subunit beta